MAGFGCFMWTMAHINLDALPVQLNIKQTADLLNLHPNTVYKMCYSGELKSHKRGSRRYVLATDLDGYITALATAV